MKHVKLLCFAHRGEAQVFLAQLKAKKKNELPDFYQAENKVYLLITGEGRMNALAATSATLGYFTGLNEKATIVNLGIAGSLGGLKLDEIYKVRTSYAHRGNQAVFHSFTTFDDNASIDSISTDERALTDEYAKTLKNFAHVVDRELWGIAKAANLFKSPFYSFKLISDEAGHQTDCFDLKHRAAYFSKKLWGFYQEESTSPTINVRSDQADKQLAKQVDILDQLIGDGFHFTQSQSDSFRKVLEQLKIKGFSFQEEMKVQLAGLKKADLSGKEKTKRLFSICEKKLNPLSAEIETELMEKLAPLHQAGWQARVPLKQDPPYLSLQAMIHTEKEKEQLAQSMQKISMPDVLI